MAYKWIDKLIDSILIIICTIMFMFSKDAEIWNDEI